MLKFALIVDRLRPPVHGFITERGNLFWKTADLAKFMGYANPYVFALDRSDKRVGDFCRELDQKSQKIRVLNTDETLELLHSMITDKRKDFRKSLKRKLWKTFQTLIKNPMTTVLETEDKMDETLITLEISKAEGSFPFWNWVVEKTEFLENEI